MDKIFRISLMVAFTCLATLVFSQKSGEFPSKLKLTAPINVINANASDQHMKDYLVKTEDGSFRLAVLSKWRIEFMLDSMDQSIWIVNVIDTAIHAKPSFKMAEPTDMKPLGDPTAKLDPKKNFCAVCDLWLRAYSVVTEPIDEPAGLRFVTNNLNAELLLESDPYEWPDKAKSRADMTIQIHERAL